MPAGDLPTVLSELGCGSAGETNAACLGDIQRTTAQGITADGDAALLVTLQTDVQVSLTFTITNKATLVPYDPNYRSYPPMPGQTSITLQLSQFGNCAGQPCVQLVVQAPDILKVGPDGNLPNYTQPVVLTVSEPGIAPAQAQVTLYSPPIYFVHGLWGTNTDLSTIQTYISGTAPWSGLPSAFFLESAYDGNIAFDSNATESTIVSEVSGIISQLGSQQVAAGRVDVVAHSMGGLVARAFSANANYKGPQNRTLGAFHQITTVDTPEAGSLLANFLIGNQTTPFSGQASGTAKLLKRIVCKTATTVGACFNTLEKPVGGGAVRSLEPQSPNLANLPPANIPNAIWRDVSATVSQADDPIANGDTNALVFDIDELIAATCPGPTYCPTKKSPIPLVGLEIGDESNDGIVALTS